MFGNYFIENALNLFFFEKKDFYRFLYVLLGMVCVLLPYSICTLQRVPILVCIVVSWFCIFGYGFCIFAFNVFLLMCCVLLYNSFVVLLNDIVVLLKDFVLLQGDNHEL